MTYRSKYISGDYNVICDICGFKVKASQTRMDRRQYSPTKGLRICLNDWDEVSPSLGPAPRIRNEQRPVRDARPAVTAGNETFRSDLGVLKWEAWNTHNWEDLTFKNWEDY